MDQELYTIGHSNHRIERFIELLNLHAVTAVCDVRSQPYSRHTPQFNREPLQKQLEAVSIAYLYLGSELGARSKDASCRGATGREQFACLSRTRPFREGIERVMARMASDRAALLCAEKDPLRCHRAMLVCRFLRAPGIVIKHILADGSLETNAEMEERLFRILHIPQDDLFMNHDQLVDRAYDMQSDTIAPGAGEKRGRHGED